MQSFFDLYRVAISQVALMRMLEICGISILFAFEVPIGDLLNVEISYATKGCG
jgi:hypothetical protein